MTPFSCLSDSATIQSALDMTHFRFQDPAIEKRADVSHPYYFIRPFVPVFTKDGVQRKQKRLRLGYCAEMNLSQAKVAKASIMSTLNQGKLVLSSQIKFSAVVERFLLTRLPQLNPSTQARYRSHIDNHLLPAFKDCRLCDIDRAMVEMWMAEKKDLSWWSRTSLKNVLSAIFTAAKEWHWFSGENPCIGVKMGTKTEKREKRLLSANQVRVLLAALPSHVAFMIAIILVTGLRISEVLGLQWSDIDMIKGTLTVRRRWHRGHLNAPKTPASKRTRQLGNLVYEFRKREIVDASTWIFLNPKTGQPYDDRELNKDILRPIAKKLGIYTEGFGFHAFRRQNITWRQEAGAHPFEAMKAAGHTRPSTTYDYTLMDSERETAQSNTILSRTGLVPSSDRRSVPAMAESGTINLSNQPITSPALSSQLFHLVVNNGGPERTRISDLFRVKVDYINEIAWVLPQLVDSEGEALEGNQTGISPNGIISPIQPEEEPDV